MHFRAFCMSFICVYSGGAADLSRVIDVGDELLAINGRSLQGLMHYDAWNVLKTASEGPIQLVIRKPRTSVWPQRTRALLHVNAVTSWSSSFLLHTKTFFFTPLLMYHISDFLARARSLLYEYLCNLCSLSRYLFVQCNSLNPGILNGFIL